MPVVAVEEAAFLLAVQRQIGGVDIQNDLLGWCGMSLQKQRHQKIIHAVSPIADLVIPVDHSAAEFQPVQGALASQRLVQFLLARHRRQQWIVAQAVVIVEVFIAQSQTEDPLCQHLLQTMLGHRRIAPVVEALAEPPDHLHLGVGLSQQHHSGVGADRSSVELGNHGPRSIAPLELVPFLATLCCDQGRSPFR